MNGQCGVCGCTEGRPCFEEQLDGSEVPCWWVQPDLCSSCQEEAMDVEIERRQPYGEADPRDLDGPRIEQFGPDSLHQVPAFRSRLFPRRVA